jgi:pilus assembly protein CpaF
MSSLDRILPFLKPIEDLLVDPAITEVMVNAGGRRVFVERSGCIEHVADRSLEIRNLTVAIKNIARACGDEISERQPMLDARLEDGSRVAAMFPPCAVDGPTLTVRKFTHRYGLDDLVDVGMLTTELADTLRAADWRAATSSSQAEPAPARRHCSMRSPRRFHQRIASC